MDMQYLVQALNQKFTESNGNPVTISLGESGISSPCSDIMTITLVPDENTLPDFASNKEGICAYPWVKVTGSGIANVMSGTTAQFLYRIADYENYKSKYEENLRKCQAFALEHKDEDPNLHGPDDIMFYQEWHRELLGFTPWGFEFNIRHDTEPSEQA